MDCLVVEVVVLASCLSVLLTASTLPWKQVKGRDVRVAEPAAETYFLGAHDVS